MFSRSVTIILCLILIHDHIAHSNCSNGGAKLDETNVNEYLAKESDNIRNANIRAGSILPRGTVVTIATTEIDNWFNVNGVGLGEYAGWYLCDGRNGTPDLRGRVQVGRDLFNSVSDYAQIGRVGGKDHVQLSVNQMPSHSHNVKLTSTSAGSHSHTFEDTMFVCDQQTSIPTDVPYKVNMISQSKYPNRYSRKAQTETVGSHSHDVNGVTEQTGLGQSFDNRQPYYVIAYIIYKGI